MNASDLPPAPLPTGFDRHPPFSLEAEVSVLGGMLIDADAVVKAAEILDEGMFFREAHRRIFRSMVRLFKDRKPVDVITLSEELKKTGELEAAGGLAYLVELLDAVPTAANLEYHAGIVREKALLRYLIEAASQIIRDAYEQGERSLEEILDEAERRVFQVAQRHDRGGFVRLKQILWATFEHIERVHESPGGITGVPTGFPKLDSLTTGLQKGDLCVVAARPGMGKTAWVLNVAQNAAIGHQIPVAIFSLEMSKEQLVQRLLCAEGRVDSQRLRQGRLSPAEFQRLARAAGHLDTAPLWIDDTPGTTVMEMRAKARRLKAQEDIQLLIVDYLQLMASQRRYENRVQEVSEISRGLKALARELQIPVLALSQLSRQPEQRGGDRRPQLSDLRDSGSIEQDADLVMFLYRPEVYFGPVDKDGKSLEGKAELIVAKQRNGPTDTVHLVFHRSYTRFDPAEDGVLEGAPPFSSDPF